MQEHIPGDMGLFYLTLILVCKILHFPNSLVGTTQPAVLWKMSLALGKNKVVSVAVHLQSIRTCSIPNMNRKIIPFQFLLYNYSKQLMSVVTH